MTDESTQETPTLAQALYRELLAQFVEMGKHIPEDEWSHHDLVTARFSLQQLHGALVAVIGPVLQARAQASAASLARLEGQVDALQALRVEHTSIIAHLQLETAAQTPWWQPMETCKRDNIVLVWFLNSHQIPRVLRAYYANAREIEVEEPDAYGVDYDSVNDVGYLPEGWYEATEYDEDRPNFLIDQPLRGWMPLPAAPAVEAPARLTAQTQATTDVLAERAKQDRKWGEQNHDPFTYLTVLIEEVGEFAQAALHLRFGGHAAEGFRKEAVQTAAVALAIVECIDRGKWTFRSDVDSSGMPPVKDPCGASSTGREEER